MDWEIAKFLAQALISVSGAFLAAYLAGKRFRTEKWWERKATAYAELVDALHQMKWMPGEHIEAEIEGRRIPKAEAEQHWNSTRSLGVTFGA